VTPEIPSERQILTPSALNRLARDLLEDALPLIWIEGELSNVSRPASGHVYFTLKDAAAQIRCAMFKPKSTWLPFKPTDGLQVLARARVSLYEARGEFQLIVEHLEQSGEGALRREFERLKARLSAEGLFAESGKRPLPSLPRRIGIITSATGAALRDVLHVLGRRFPMVEVEILPTPVQGREAPAAIIAMLDAAAKAMRHDVLLLTRGGGSLEDLWAFNDEGVARAIARCPIPVVSAIGHEIDFSIADLVADLRAATPSAAAELLVPDAGNLRRVLSRNNDRLRLRTRRKLESVTQKLDHLHARLMQQRPSTRLGRGSERLAQLRARLARAVQGDSLRRRTHLSQTATRLRAQHPRKQIDRAGDDLRARASHLRAAILRMLERRRSRTNQLGGALHALSPLGTLARGYSILIEQSSSNIVRSTAQVDQGSLLRGILADGELRLRVESGN